MESILLFLALIFVLHVAFALLALSQDRNRRRVIAVESPWRFARIVFRTVGYALLGFGLLLAQWLDGPAFGSLLWVTLLSIAACGVTLILRWQPVWLKPLVLLIHAIIALLSRATDSADLRRS